MASCLLLDLGLYVKQAALVAVIAFVLALICLLAATIYYTREVRVALSSVQEEGRDFTLHGSGHT